MNKHLKELKKSAGHLMFWGSFFAVFMLGYILLIDNGLLKDNDCPVSTEMGTTQIR